MTDEEPTDAECMDMRDKAADMANKIDALLVASPLIVAEMALALLVVKLVCNTMMPEKGLEQFCWMVGEMLRMKAVTAQEAKGETSH